MSVIWHPHVAFLEGLLQTLSPHCTPPSPHTAHLTLHPTLISSCTPPSPHPVLTPPNWIEARSDFTNGDGRQARHFGRPDHRLALRPAEVPPGSSAGAGVILFRGPQARRYTHNAVHTKGGLWPPQESSYLGGHRQGSTHTTRCTHKARHIKGGLWPPQESCYLRGHRQGGVHTTRYTQKAVQTQGGTTKGGLWPPQESCYFRGHRQGGTHTTRYTHKAVHTQDGLWPLLFKGPQGGFAFSRGTWGAGCIGTSRQFGRPEYRPAVAGQPTPPLATSLSAEPHRRRASPPFHSDELATIYQAK